MNDAAPRSYVYKRVGACEIALDIYPGGRGASPPLIVCLHGGALIAGGRQGYPQPHVLACLREMGWVASLDYRLAPETPLTEIVSDLYDGLAWLRDRAPALCGVDSDRLAVLGGSAGGYLTLMAGLAMPRPRALVSFYGYGDLAGPWYSRPDPFYRQWPEVTREAAYAALGDRPLTHAPFAWEGRARFYLYCRQQGLWPRLVTGWDPDTAPQRYGPYEPVRQVTPEYPPTLLLHGDADADVPYSRSVAMAEALGAAGVPHEFVTLPGSGHGFEADPEAPATACSLARVRAFLQEHLSVC